MRADFAPPDAGNHLRDFGETQELALDPLDRFGRMREGDRRRHRRTHEHRPLIQRRDELAAEEREDRGSCDDQRGRRADHRTPMVERPQQQRTIASLDPAYEAGLVVIVRSGWMTIAVRCRRAR